MQTSDSQGAFICLSTTQVAQRNASWSPFKSHNEIIFHGGMWRMSRASQPEERSCSAADTSVSLARRQQGEHAVAGGILYFSILQSLHQHLSDTANAHRMIFCAVYQLQSPVVLSRAHLKPVCMVSSQDAFCCSSVQER